MSVDSRRSYDSNACKRLSQNEKGLGIAQLTHVKNGFAIGPRLDSADLGTPWCSARTNVSQEMEWMTMINRVPHTSTQQTNTNHKRAMVNQVCSCINRKSYSCVHLGYGASPIKRG